MEQQEQSSNQEQKTNSSFERDNHLIQLASTLSERAGKYTSDEQTAQAVGEWILWIAHPDSLQRLLSETEHPPSRFTPRVYSAMGYVTLQELLEAGVGVFEHDEEKQTLYTST